MSDLKNVVEVDDNSQEKEDILNQIIAAGLNSYKYQVTSGHALSPEKALFDKFVSQSFDRIIPCFNLLDVMLQLYVFKPHKEAFLEFMKSKAGGE